MKMNMLKGLSMMGKAPHKGGGLLFDRLIMARDTIFDPENLNTSKYCILESGGVIKLLVSNDDDVFRSIAWGVDAGSKVYLWRGYAYDAFTWYDWTGSGWTYSGAYSIYGKYCAFSVSSAEQYLQGNLKLSDMSDSSGNTVIAEANDI